MSSKKFLQIGVALLLTLSSVGCSEFLNGKKTEPEVIEFSDERFACLQKLPGQIKKFSVGDAQESEIRSGVGCMSEALLYFNKRTFGSLEGAYTVEEMRKFFGKYFLKQNNVSPQFAAELMKIKRVLLGGSIDYLTKEEIIRLVDILAVVRDEAVQLTPHMKILLNQPVKSKIEWENVSEAIEQLRHSLQRLLVNTQIVKSEYGFEDVKKALVGFAEFVKGEEPFAPYDRYSSWVPVVEAVKNVLMGRRANFADLKQWGESLNTLIDLYELALRHHYSLKDLQFADASKVRQASQFAQQALKLLKNAHQMKMTGRIPAEDLDNLIEQVLPKVKSSIGEKAWKKTYRAVLIKILNSEGKGDSLSFVGLERKHLTALEREFNIWRLQQSFVDHIPMEEFGGGVTPKELLQIYSRFNKTFIIERGLSGDPFEQRALELAWEDLGHLLRSPFSVSFNQEGQLIIDSRYSSLKQSWASLTKSNLMRALSRLLMRGYGSNTKELLNNAGMTEKGLIAWYDDFQELGLEIKAFDPRSANSGSRSFLEANFFTFSGNGNDLMDQRESYEFVSTLFSAGLSTSEKVRQQMVVAQCTTNEKDVFGFPFIKEPCFKSQLRKYFDLYFKNLPGMVRYVKSLDSSQWNVFYRFLAVAAAVKGQKFGYVETANIRSMVMILHYIESIVVLYDQDHSQGLSLKEVYSATPRFMSFFKTVAGTQSQTLLREGFAYLVFKGSIPDASDLAAFQLDKMWGLKEAQRLEIVRLFGVLKHQLNKPKK